MSQTTFHKHSVMYADDDFDDLKLVEQAFSESTLNIRLVTVNDGEKAIEYLSSLSALDPSPCLIILDINMPRLNGKETLLKIRKMERFMNTPAVLFSTSSMEHDRDFAFRHNAGFITKPLNTLQMQRIAEQFIEYCSDEVRRNVQRAV